MRPMIVKPADVRPLNVLGVEHIPHVTGSDSNGALVVLELRMPAGLGIPLHVHTREDEVFHVLTGELEFLLDGRTQTASPGVTVFGPRNVPHGFRAVGCPASMLVTIHPSGIEPMFVELAKLPPGPPDLQRVSEITGRFGISVL